MSNLSRNDGSPAPEKSQATSQNAASGQRTTNQSRPSQHQGFEIRPNTPSLGTNTDRPGPGQQHPEAETSRWSPNTSSLAASTAQKKSDTLHAAEGSRAGSVAGINATSAPTESEGASGARALSASEHDGQSASDSERLAENFKSAMMQDLEGSKMLSSSGTVAQKAAGVE